MAWIETKDESQWDGKLAELLPRVVDPETGNVDNVMAIHWLDAGSLEAHLSLYRQAMRGSQTLPKVDREMIALVVSQLNACRY